MGVASVCGKLIYNSLVKWTNHFDDTDRDMMVSLQD